MGLAQAASMGEDHEAEQPQAPSPRAGDYEQKASTGSGGTSRCSQNGGVSLLGLGGALGATYFAGLCIGSSAEGSGSAQESSGSPGMGPRQMDTKPHQELEPFKNPLSASRIGAVHTCLGPKEVASQCPASCNPQKHLKDLVFEASDAAGSCRGVVLSRCKSGKKKWHNWKRRREPGIRKKSAVNLSGAQ